jgi:hypothetical protein
MLVASTATIAATATELIRDTPACIRCSLP